MNKASEIRKIISQLMEWDAEYDNGVPSVSDKEYDEVYFKLKTLEQETGLIFSDSPTQKIDYQVVNALQKVKHNHPMLSLDKTKNWSEFLSYFSDIDISKSVTGMLKLDGLTLSLTYRNGELVRAETRGNGEIGEDVLHNAFVIPSIPRHIPYKDELVVDGEVICTAEDFKEFSADYANPRNFASGSIRLLDSAECAKRRLTFVVWNAIYNQTSFIKMFEELSDYGFTTVPWVSSFDLDAKEFLIEEAERLGYPIDGLVGRFDDIQFGESLGETAHHSRAAFAFKFYDEEHESTLKDIVWQVGRTGVVTPVGIFEEIDFGDSVVNRASLHNLSIMKETLGETPHIGQTVYVVKQNMIIPDIIRADLNPVSENLISFPTQCPICGGKIEVHESESGVLNYYCENSECGGKLLNKAVHFCSKDCMDIRGLSKATIGRLIDWGWLDNLLDIFSLKEHREEWIEKTGFGLASVNKILTAIEESKSTTFDRFLASLGIHLIGRNVAKDLGKHIKSYSEFREMINNNFDFSEYSGFAESKCNALLTFDYSEADKIAELLTFKEDATQESSENSLKELTFVITGSVKKFKNRSELESFITSKGGRCSSSVSKNTKYLINNDINSTSSKNLAAQRLGVPILTEEDFLSKFDFIKKI